jgi:hypothetical protein
MNRFLTKAACAFLLLGIFLSSGCLGEKTTAATSIKYVCGDGSIVSESKECRTGEKAGICNQTCPVPVEKACICNQTCAAPMEKTVLPVEQNISLPVNVTISSGPCESMGCPPDALFVGNNETKKFHECDCGQAARISSRKRVCLISAEYAESMGYVPCGFCKPSDDPKT